MRAGEEAGVEAKTAQGLMRWWESRMVITTSDGLSMKGMHCVGVCIGMGSGY